MDVPGNGHCLLSYYQATADRIVACIVVVA
jgi:hypothetical protein